MPTDYTLRQRWWVVTYTTTDGRPQTGTLLATSPAHAREAAFQSARVRGVTIEQSTLAVALLDAPP